MRERKFLKEVVVLLLASLMIFSSGFAMANTEKQSINKSAFDRGLVWDNVVGVHGDLGGIIVATVRTEGNASPADDFKFDASQEVVSIFWQGGYFQCQLAQGQMDYHWDWHVIFWDDIGDGSHPNNKIYEEIIPDAEITREFWYNYTRPDTGNTYWVANYSASLASSYTFSANTIYWITIQGMQGTNAYPQACWSRHNITVGGIKLHEAVILAPWWGYPDWTNISVLVPGNLPHDLNFQLFGPSINNPPGDPTIRGPDKGEPNVVYNYTVKAEDPDLDQVYYYIDWGDGTNSGWIGPYPSGADIPLNHSWPKKGTYIVKVKAKDTNGAESGWTSLTVTIPRTKSINNFIQQSFKRFPNAFPILRKILKI